MTDPKSTPVRTAPDTMPKNETRRQTVAGKFDREAWWGNRVHSWLWISLFSMLLMVAAYRRINPGKWQDPRFPQRAHTAVQQ